MERSLEIMLAGLVEEVKDIDVIREKMKLYEGDSPTRAEVILAKKMAGQPYAQDLEFHSQETKDHLQLMMELVVKGARINSLYDSMRIAFPDEPILDELRKSMAVIDAFRKKYSDHFVKVLSERLDLTPYLKF